MTTVKDAQAYAPHHLLMLSWVTHGPVAFCIFRICITVASSADAWHTGVGFNCTPDVNAQLADSCTPRMAMLQTDIHNLKCGPIAWPVLLHQHCPFC